MIVAIIQARMTSSRLPGKSLKPVLDKPVIGYLLERVQRSKKIDQIVVAMTDRAEDDPLQEYVESVGVDVFRGSEDDVLERYYLAAKKYDADTVVRITGDCILFEPQYCDMLIETHAKVSAPYAYLGPKFAEGLDCEVMDFSLLEHVYNNARVKSEREHVTLYLHNRKDEFDLHMVTQEQDDGHYRIVLDEPEDLKALDLILQHFYPRYGADFHYTQVRDFLNDHPDIQKINNHIIRNEGLLISLEKDGVEQQS